MAVDVDQDYVTGHTSIYRTVAVVPTLPFSYVMWFKALQFGITKILIEQAQFLGNPGDRFSLRLSGGDSSGKVVASVADFVYFAESETSNTFLFNEWNHAAAVFSGAGNLPTAITAYLNGVAGPTNNNPSSLSPDGLQRTRIFGGRDDNSSFGFQGCAAVGLIYAAALSADDVAQLYAGADPNTIAGGPVSYFNFTDEATATVDETGATWAFSEQAGGFTTCIDGPDDQAPVETGEEDECGAEDEADATAPCDVEWPACDLVPTRIQVDVVAPSASPGRSFTGIEQLVQPDPGHWRITFHEIPIRTKARALQWREIENALKGRNGTVCVPVYEGKLSAVPIVAAVAGDYEIGATQIGIEQTAGATIRAGMQFSHGERLHILLRIITSEDNVHSVAITPPLREALSADDALDFNTPLCRCRLERDDSMGAQLDLLRFSRPSVTFVEDV